VAKGELREAVSDQVVRILRDERKRLGISMEVLADRAGLSQSIISLIERDLRNPTLDTLLRIADVLQIDLADILAKAQKAAAEGKKKR
jgi:transcriptional regulator with XRE-family HTH domain